MSLNNNNSATKKPTPSGTTDSPYLGSKISLVSKAKIRYEGILYTIDANESTVALSKVRSFGTEDRPTDRPVPPRDEIFEYIIFRGADIEDLQVREPPQTTLTQDPAIVESSMYPSTGRSTASGNLPNSSTTNSNNVSSPSVPSGSNRQMKSLTNNDPLRQLNTQSTSRSFNQQQNSDGQDFSYGNQRRSGRQQQDYYNDQRRTGSGKYGYNEWPRTNNSAWENNYRQNQPQQQRYPRQQQQQQQQQNYENNNRFYPNRRQQQQQQQSNGGYRERRNSTGEMTGNQQRNNRQRVDSTRGNANNQSALKFIGDFDFEKSNAEFDKNAIEDEIKKSLSIKTTKDKTKESTPTEQPAQIENLPTEQSPAPTQPTSITTVEKTERQDQDANPDGFYDKQKSFFDRISCETTEKEKTSNARRNWNEERRLNAETFGLRYRPGQQQQQQQQQGGGYQRNTGGYNYNNNNQRRNYGGGQQQSFYGNGARYQRGGGGGGGGSGQQRGRNNTYYNNNNNNNNNRMRAY